MNILKIVFFCLTLIACSHSPQWSKKQKPNTVSVMTYNLENLFDTLHDKDREDFAYLPKNQKGPYIKECKKIRNTYYQKICLTLDWTQSVLDKKLDNLATAILQVNKGRGPDILIVTEVENLNVLKQLNKKLKRAHYNITHIEGFDKRGIDIAFLSRLKRKGKPTLHRIAFKAKNARDKKWMMRSRGILEATMILPSGELANIFGVHFPSPRNPTYWRAQAIETLNRLVNRLPKNRLALAGGDFNITRKENNRKYFYEKILGKVWKVSHLMGCDSCQGTYPYKGSWSFLDALLLRRALHPWHIDKKSVGIPNRTRVQLNPYSNPARFNAKTGYGTSDHFPIYLQIQLNKQTLPKK